MKKNRVEEIAEEVEEPKKVEPVAYFTPEEIESRYQDFLKRTGGK